MRPHAPLFVLLALLVPLTACGGASETGSAGGAFGTITSPSPTGTTEDRDGDGLLNEEETAERTIWIDTSGFGIAATRANLVQRVVSSDPDDADSDDDGLTDLEEFLIRTDPTDPDTDDDGLGDYEEWYRWLTSPVSVDSDSDARGPTGEGPPNASLFDKAELDGTAKGATSPTLADTDGDGMTDAEEIDHPFRSPLIAELPAVQLELVGTPDIRLFVEYEDAREVSEEYSSVLSESSETSTATSHSSTHEKHRETSASIAVSAGVTLAGPDNSSAQGQLTIGASQTWGRGFAFSSAYERTSTQATSREAGRYWGSSETRTETAASGEVRFDFRIRNVSRFMSFRMTQLGIAARMWVDSSDPREPGRYQTMAVLTPQGFDSFTLAPGATTGVLPAIATDVNPDLIKAFLTRPERLSFDPVYYDLENAEGIDFDFLTENAFSQTALIEIDVGEGEPEEFRVATNVERTAPLNGNGGGRYAGLSLRTALEQILGRRLQTVMRDVTYKGLTRSTEVLSSLEGYAAIRSPIDPLLTGTVNIQRESTTVTFATLSTPESPTELPIAELDEGYEDTLIGRTLVATINGRARAFVIVAAIDPAAGTFQVHAAYTGLMGAPDDNVRRCQINDLYQVQPHADPEDPSRPAAVVPSPVQAFWLVLASEDAVVDPHTDFSDIVLRAGDQVRLSYWIDADGDGVSSRTEQAAGTADSGENSADVDGDGLMDSVETIRGWIAGAPEVLPIERDAFFDMLDRLRENPLVDWSSDSPEHRELRRLRAKLVLDDPVRKYPRLVFSSATEQDSDGDELADLFECMNGTDPNRADTDGDGLDDPDDPFPLHPARILHVNAAFTPPLDDDGVEVEVPGLNDASRGLGWDTAFLHLQDALIAASRRNSDYVTNEDGDFLDERGRVTTDASEYVLDPSNDISAIWVAAGAYQPTAWSDDGPAAAAFADDGKEPYQRSFELVPNVTIYGGFLGNEERLSDRADQASPTLLTGGAREQRVSHIVRAGRANDDSGAAITPLTGLDRVTIERGGRDASFSEGRALGGGFVNEGGQPTLREVTFTENSAVRGGAVYEGPGMQSDGSMRVAGGRYIDCVFTANSVSELGGAICFQHSRARLEGCSFENNTAPRPKADRPTWGADARDGDGGAVAALGGQTIEIEGCTFRNQLANRGGALFVRDANAMVRNCIFIGNSTDPGTRDGLASKFHHWVRGLKATVNGGRVDRLRQNPNLSKAERTSWNEYRDIENARVTDPVAKEGDRIKFGPGSGPVDGLGEYEKSGGKPEWTAPKHYREAFEKEILEADGDGKSQAAGGAIFVNGSTRLAVVQCVFHRNTASVGGAIVFNSTKSVTILNCTFARNQGLGLAGAIFSKRGSQGGLMANCILAGQSATIWERPKKPNFEINGDHKSTSPGGDPYTLFGLFPYFDATSVEEKDRFPGGDISRGGGEYYADGWRNLGDFEFRDGDIPHQLYLQDNAFDVENCLLRDVPTGGRGGRFEDGQLGNRVGGNGPAGEIDLANPDKASGLVPLATSHAIDNGRSTLDYDPFQVGLQGPPEADLAGNPRRSGIIDIGAYEYQHLR